MGQGIACAHRASDGKFIYGSGFHPDILKAWEEKAERSGWVCSESRLNLGPNKYVMGDYGYFQDPMLGEKCRQQTIDFFSQHCSSIDGVLGFLRHNRKYCGVTLQEELLYLLNGDAKDIFFTMKGILEKRRDKQWTPERKRFDKELRQAAKDMESAIKGIIIEINDKIRDKKYRLPLTSDTVVIRDALYLAASNKTVNHKTVKNFETSLSALRTYYDDVLRRISRNKKQSRSKMGGEDTFLSELEIFEKLANNSSLQSNAWRGRSSVPGIRKMSTKELFFHREGFDAIPMGENWKIENDRGYNMLFSNNSDINAISVNTDNAHYELQEDMYGYPTLVFRLKR